jgi:molybdopterin-containing oxidoreductase family membrane subunit
MYYPTVWDWALYIGTIGLFFFLLFLFIRFLPMISIFEMRTLVPATGEEPPKKGLHIAASAGPSGEARRP